MLILGETPYKYNFWFWFSSSDFDLQKLIFGNFEEFSLFFKLLDKKKFKTKSCTYAFSSSEKQIFVKKIMPNI